MKCFLFDLIFATCLDATILLLHVAKLFATLGGRMFLLPLYLACLIWDCMKVLRNGLVLFVKPQKIDSGTEQEIEKESAGKRP